MNVGHENQPNYDGASIPAALAVTNNAGGVQLPATNGGLYYLRNAGSTNITLGTSASLTAGTGYTLTPGDVSPPIVLKSLALLWAIATTSPSTLEIFGQV